MTDLPLRRGLLWASKPFQASRYNLRFSPDGKLIAATSETLTLQVWDTATGKVRFTSEPGQARSSPTFCPDGQSVFGQGDDNIVRVWDIATGKVRFASEVGQASYYPMFSPDGKSAVTHTEDGLLEL